MRPTLPAMDERPNVTFQGYKSLNEEFRDLARDKWGASKEEAINAAMLVFLELQSEDQQNALCAIFRHASSRQVRSGNPIRDEFKHALAKFQQTLGTGKAFQVGDAIKKTHGKDGDRRSEGQK